MCALIFLILSWMLVICLEQGSCFAGSSDEPTTPGMVIVPFHQQIEDLGIYNIQKAEEEKNEEKEKIEKFNRHFLAGTIYLEHSLVSKALEEFRLAREIFPDSTAALYAIAYAHFLLDEFDKSLKVLEELLALEPKDLDALLLKAKTLNITGKWKEAKIVYEKVIEQKPYNLEALKARGNIAHSQENDFKQAGEYYKKVLEVVPKDTAALIIVGTSAALQDKLEEAQDYLFRAIQQNPEFIGPYIRLGNLLESRGKLETAYKIYRQTLIANPSNHQAQFYFALAANKLKGEEGALSAYKELAEEFPVAPDIQLLYARQLLSKNKLAEAEKVLLRLMELSPGMTAALISMGELFLKGGEIKKAEEYFQKAIALEPKDLSLYTQIAQLFTAQKQLEEAANYLQEALNLQPERSELFIALVENYYKQNLLEKAEEVLKRTIDRGKNQAALYSLLGTLYRAQGKLEEALTALKQSIALEGDNLETYVQIISLYLQTQQNEKARETTKQAEELFLKEHPRDLYYNITVVYEQWGHYDEALEYLEKLLQKEGDYLPAYSELAHIYNLKRNYDKAKEVFKRAREKLGEKAESTDFYLLEGVAFLEQRSYDEAAGKFKKVVNKDPGNLTGYSELISTYILSGKYSQAMTSLNLAKEKFGMDKPELRKLEAQLYMRQKEFKKAEKIFNDLLRQDQEDVDLLYQLAGLYYEAKEFDKAVKAFEKILTLEPTHIDTLNSLGYTLAIQGKELDKAEEYIRRALNFKPYAGYIIDSLGWVYYQRAQYEKARELIERANQLELEDPEIQEHLGDVYEKLGDKAKALRYWQRAVELDPEREKLKQKIKRIKK